MIAFPSHVGEWTYQAAPNIVRLDFPTLVHNVTNYQGTIFNWDSNDDLTNIYPLNETYFQTEENPLFTFK